MWAFHKTIIVSENVFLGEKVKRLGVGYVINSMDEGCVIQFLNSLNNADYQEKIDACKSISQKECLNDNQSFFDYISTL